MNQMGSQELQQHTTVLGWLYVVGSIFFLVIGGFVFLLLTGIGVATGEAEPMTILAVVGTAVSLLLVVLGLPGLLAGYGLLTHKPWARILTMVVGILGLFNFPVGTLIGIYTLWVLTQPAATDYFAAPVSA